MSPMRKTALQPRRETGSGDGADRASGPGGARASRRMRIARALAMVGTRSRRESERLVSAGWVTVNGADVTDLATLVDPSRDTIAVNGVPLHEPAPFAYYALHKPRGVVSTVRDPHATHTVVQLVPSEARLYPVGRLDKDSEGLLLLTNDGDFANAVTHPRYEVEKEYQALVAPPPSANGLEQLRAGVSLDGRLVAPRAIGVRAAPEGTWVRVILHEGQKREVRRLLRVIGLTVRRLVRTRIGSVRLGRLKPGEYRPLRRDEIRALLEPNKPFPWTLRSAESATRSGSGLEGGRELAHASSASPASPRFVGGLSGRKRRGASSSQRRMGTKRARP